MSEMENQPLLIDVSSWQNQLNYNAITGSSFDTVHGIISRAGWGEDGGYYDQQFERNWLKSEQFNFMRSSYWALWPFFPHQHQLDLWFNACPEIDFLPRVIDMEVGNAPSNFIADVIYDMSNQILARDGFRPWIYSRVDLVEKWLTPNWTTEMLNEHYYMLAQYDVGDAKEYNGIVVPDGVNAENILLKQTSDKIPIYEGSGAVDRDRWIWDDVEGMLEFLGEQYGEVPEPPPVEPPPVDLPNDERWDLQIAINSNIETRVVALEIKSHSHPQWMDRFFRK